MLLNHCRRTGAVANRSKTAWLLSASIEGPKYASNKVFYRTNFLSSYAFNSGTFDDDWPIRVRNTVINVCPQGEKMAVERLGKLLKIEDSGWFIAIPIIDKIAYRIDMRERTIAIKPQSAITKDNVSVMVSGNLYVQFVDAEKAAYGSTNPVYSVRQFSQSSMRSAIGELELDEILHARSKLNKMIGASVQDAAMAWGLDVKRYEITAITPDAQISEAMDKQAAAERARRERVLTAEGEKRAAQLKSEGVKLQLINESEGHLIKVQNEAKASKERIELEAQGQAAAVLLAAEAQAKAIASIASVLNSKGGEGAAQLAIAKQYIEMYGNMGSKSNTILFSERPADVTHLLAQAATVLNVTLGKNKELPGATNVHKKSEE